MCCIYIECSIQSSKTFISNWHPQWRQRTQFISGPLNSSLHCNRISITNFVSSTDLAFFNVFEYRKESRFNHGLHGSTMEMVLGYMVYWNQNETCMAYQYDIWIMHSTKRRVSQARNDGTFHSTEPQICTQRRLRPSPFVPMSHLWPIPSRIQYRNPPWYWIWPGDPISSSC